VIRGSRSDLGGACLLLKLQRFRTITKFTLGMDETRNRSESAGELDPLDPLACFLPETEMGISSSSSATRTVSSPAYFPTEQPSPAIEPRAAAAHVPRLLRAEAPVPTHIDSVVSSTRFRTRLWATLRTLPPSALGIVCLAVFLPSLATLIVLRTPMLSTGAPLEPAQDVAPVGTVRQVEQPRDAQRLPTQASRVSAPRDPNDAFVIVAPKEPRPSPGATDSALTSPPSQTTASLVLPPPPQFSRPDGAVRTAPPPARSADPVSVNVTAKEEKAKRVTPVLGRTTSTDRPTHYGAMSVESQPTGAQVSIDGQLVGVTPLVGWEVPARSHVLRIDMDGYERWSASIRVVAEQTTNVIANLQPTRQP
jgi:PEGA domain